MAFKFPIETMPPLVKDFASYKLTIQGCSQKTVDEYLVSIPKCWIASYPFFGQDPKALTLVLLSILLIYLKISTFFTKQRPISTIYATLFIDKIVALSTKRVI